MEIRLALNLRVAKTAGIPVETVIAQYGEVGRLGVASNSYVSAANARRLGWSPKGPSLGEWLGSKALKTCETA